MARSPLLIVGQGLAGTLLGFACERARLDFEIVDAGHAAAASRISGGLLNPLTGRRLTRTWRADRWTEPAVAVYRDLERILSVPLIRPVTIRRRWRTADEREIFEARRARGEYGGLTVEAGDDELRIGDAYRVDSAALIERARRRWQEGGRLQTRPALAADLDREARPVVLCPGGNAPHDSFPALPWQRSVGEVLTIAVRGLSPDLVRNEGHWLVPLTADSARVGAVYRPLAAGEKPTPTAEGKAELMEAAGRLTGGGPFEVLDHAAGARLAVTDRRPAMGASRLRKDCWIFGGLASKGILWAPILAAQLVDHWEQGTPLEPEADVARFGVGLGERMDQR